MLTKEDRIIFHKLLDYLGVELRLRCVGGGPPDRNNSANNGLYFYTKKDGHILLETTSNFGFEDSWNVGGEKNAARFLLESCIDFIDVSYCNPNSSWRTKKIIENPFFGCKSLEEAMIKLDLLNTENDKK